MVISFNDKPSQGIEFSVVKGFYVNEHVSSNVSQHYSLKCYNVTPGPWGHPRVDSKGSPGGAGCLR